MAGKKVSSVVTYYGAAAKTKKRDSLDLTKNVGAPGAVYGGPSWDTAAAAANQHYAALPNVA